MEDLHGNIHEHLQRDILAADFLTSVFWSAMSSFRHDTILRPFPPMFLTGEVHKDIEGVRSAFHSLPPLDQVLEGSESNSPSEKSLELLHWILDTRTFTVNYTPNSTFEEVISQTSSPSAVKPQFIFELCYSPESEQRFQSTASPHGVLYAYHGSQLENFYSILHNGLLSHFNKTSAFGEGTYLSTELGVCLNWSPNGHLWPKSVLPHTASCVAVCELIKHPTIMSRAQLGGDPSIQGKVPEKYFIVSNDEMLRVKYVLVFGRQRPRPRTQSWLMKHKFVIVIAIYLLFLLCMGVFNSKQFRQLYAKHSTKWPWR